MGVTIHYHGGLDDPRQLDVALDMLREECDRRSWPYRKLDFEAKGKFETESFRAEPSDIPGVEDIIVETEYAELDTRWRGLSIDPHPECESLLLMFDPQNGRLLLLISVGEAQSLSYYLSVKTQFAPVEIHTAICEVLHRLQDEFGRAQLVVSDESGYFDTGDVEPLLKMRRTIEDVLNNPELVLRLTRWATAGEEAAPPDEEQLTRRLN